MQRHPSFELPDNLKPKKEAAIKLEWTTVIYLSSVVVVMYLTLGASQAMKAAWLEDVLSIIPAISFLIATKINNKSRNQDFPYGYHRIYSIAYLTGSFALFGMGCFLIVDSGITLFLKERPTIGSMLILGNQIWFGWIMIAALLYSSLPAMILGFKKLPLSKKLHNKILYTDAEAQKADYMTAFSAIAGIIGIGLGFWWADAIAALFISVSVIKDGYSQFKTAILDLMDRHPVHTDDHKKDELVPELEKFVNSWEWVERGKVRFREHGQVYFGEVFVIAKNETGLIQNIEEGVKKLRDYHWKIYDVVITPVRELPEG